MKHLISRFLLVLALTLSTGLIVRGQGATTITPDCVVFFNWTGNGVGTQNTFSFPNTSWGCNSWTVDYQAIGTGSMTGLTVQSAPLSAMGTATNPLPGTWGTYAGTVLAGINPNTSNTGAVTQFVNGLVVTPFMRVFWTEGSFVGSLNGVLYGWRTQGNSSAGGGGGSGSCTGLTGVDEDQLLFTDGMDGCTSSPHFVVNTSDLPVPGLPVLATVGAAGATSYGYTLVGRNLIGGSVPGMEATIGTGNATLNGSNYINITAPSCPDTRVTSYDVYRTTAGGMPATLGLIGNVVCSGILADQGLSARPFSYPPYMDYSIGSGSDLPYVNTSNGSCFGYLCSAYNDLFFFFFDSGTGLTVAESTSDPAFDTNGLYAYLLYDTNTSDKRPLKAQLVVGTDLSSVGSGHLEPFVSFFTDDGHTVTMGYVGSEVADILITGDLTVSPGGVAAHRANIGFGSAAMVSAPYVTSYYSRTSVDGSLTTPLQGFYASSPVVMGTLAEYDAFWSSDLGGLPITNGYYEWFDSRGVYRIREDSTFNAVGQAIAALYNPQFTKYTPGAVDFERCIPGCQWNSNVAEIGAEKGGTGVLREVRVIGQDLQIPSLAFASLGTPANSSTVYCTNCNITSAIDDTCATGGSGAWAERINSVWKCSI